MLQGLESWLAATGDGWECSHVMCRLLYAGPDWGTNDPLAAQMSETPRVRILTWTAS